MLKSTSSLRFFRKERTDIYMAYVMFKHPLVSLDLMIRKEYWPKIASVIDRCNCTYDEEHDGDIEGSGSWVTLKNVRSREGRAHELGELIGLFYSMEWDSLTQGKEDKFYILLNPKKNPKKGTRRNDQENRPQTGAGRKGGNTGKPAGYFRFGPGAATDRINSSAGTAGADNSGELPQLVESDDGNK